MSRNFNCLSPILDFSAGVALTLLVFTLDMKSVIACP